ncbi:MAG: lipopolysaccharide biosynthesis protein [Ginsengibacter sp.]
MESESLHLKMRGKILEIFAYIITFLNKGQGRSVKAKKNILASFFLKGTSIVVSLFLVRLNINYLNESRYGIWITITSIVGWFSFFDIGLTQGLRNKFAEAKAKGEDELAQIYVSTTYGILAIIFAFVWLAFLICNNFLNWANILKLPQSMRSEVSVLAIIVFTYFCINFVLRIISTLVTANQEPAKASLIDVLGQILSLIFIVILTETTEGSLIKLGIAFCLSPIIILIGANLFFFRGSFRRYSPKFSKIRFSYAKGLFNVGVIFFIIQIAGIIQFQTANIIIAQNFPIASVTSYNIVYKYFGVLDMIFVIFLSPFWSACTDAYFRNDILWIKKAVKKYQQLTILLTFFGIIMLICSHTIYNVWLNGKVNISFSLSLWGFLYFVVTMFGYTYVYFLNGINALRIQFFACILSPLIYVGVAILLIQYYKMGVYSLFIASIIANFNAFILSPLQYHMIINKNKKGIWIK